MVLAQQKHVYYSIHEAVGVKNSTQASKIPVNSCNNQCTLLAARLCFICRRVVMALLGVDRQLSENHQQQASLVKAPTE